MADLDCILEKLTALGEGQAGQTATCKECMKVIVEHHHTLYGDGEAGLKIRVDRIEQAGVERRRVNAVAASIVAGVVSTVVSAMAAIFGR